MFKKISSYVSTLVLALALAACAAPGAQPGQMEIRTGVVEQIIHTELSSDHHSGVGAVVGGLAGLGVGSLIGAGTGRDVAMVLGAVGGAVAGHEIQKKYDQPVPAQQVIVRVSSGVLVSVTQPVNPAISKGQRVYIEGSGEDARVVPR
ncbi:glycine zipper 2TM domain-containing protein [Candidatus Accumulibacter sp. ACC007]|uniref:glycine zipper 2TM domain-containing protein n=1 Tax=Candidatus Accumulibacter sp. ACC007 TaxID=2823333 RepID=UPI0025C2518B|nr:glycine zipper 2TM domain-containing protein [Candidatus Accumulibacter sp. ACC007]